MDERLGTSYCRDVNGSPTVSYWKQKLFILQENAPKPDCVVCSQKLSSCPKYYGAEYHGPISREETEVRLQQHGDGGYLVRESKRSPGAYTLCFLFDGQVRNYKLFYDGMHFVGEKKFETVHDLVADGLITLHIERNAAEYIRHMADETDYECSPYSSYVRAQCRIRDGTNLPKSSLSFSPNADSEIPFRRLSLVGSAHSFDTEASLKAHLFKIHSFKGVHWCDFCGNFLWGLVQQGYKCFDCGFAAHKKCSEKVLPECVPHLKYVTRLFGIDLTTWTMAHRTVVPIVVEKCIAEIELRGLESEGIYRVPGFHEEIESLRALFDSKGNADLSAHKVEDINTVACLLKLYLRMLPLPLIPPSFCRSMVEALQQCKHEREKIAVIRKIAATLPYAHYSTLEALMKHLNKVALNSAKNRMSHDNLALIFYPTVVRSTNSFSAFSSPHEQFIVQAMISFCPEIFIA